MPDFRFDPRTGRYREAGGRFVAQARVRGGVDAVVAMSGDRLAGAAESLRNGGTLADFQAALYRHIKDVHVSTALAAYGGRAQMTPERWGYVGSRIRSEYGYARGFVGDIASGKQPMTKALDARARQYAQAGRVTFEAVQARLARARGQTQERNVLHANESCAECRGLASRGWVARGTLPVVGARSCRQRCRCTIERRDGASSEAA